MSVFDKGTQVAGQNDLWPGLFTTGTIPEDYMPRGMDNLGQMSWITKGTNKFLHMLHTRYNQSKTKDTREHRVHELEELDRTFILKKGYNVTNDHTKLVFKGDIAAQVQPNDTLHVPKLFSRYNPVSGKIEYSRIFNEQFNECEQMAVLAVLERDTANDEVTILVRRGDYGKGKGDLLGQVVEGSNVDYTNGALVEGDIIVRGLPNFPEGGDAPRGFFKNPVVDNNFTQEFKYAVEITKESEIEKTWIGKTPIQIYRLLKTRQATLDIERAFLFSRKGKKQDKLGRVQYSMGGVIEYIPKDNRHVHIFNQPLLSYPDILDFISKVPEEGGSQTRDFYCGIDLYVELKKAFYSSGYLRYDEKASKEFDIPIESLVGAGITLRVIPLYTLQELGWGYRGLCLDFSVPSFVPVTHTGWDMKLEKDIAAKGQQIYKEQWIGIKGLERRYAQYQHILDFSSIA